MHANKQTILPSTEGGPPANMCMNYVRVTVFSCDLDPDPMTLMYELDLDILKTYLPSNMNFLGQCFQKLEDEQDRQTDRQNALAQPCSWVVVG